MLALRDLDTGMFFSHCLDGHWTADPKRSDDMLDMETARQVAKVMNLKKGDVVSLSEDGRITAVQPI